MRTKLVALAAALALLAGCRTKVKQDATVARTSDTSVRIDVASNGTIVLKSGVLIVPFKVTNRRDRFVQVFFDRSEIEDVNGERRHRRPTSASNITIGPGRSETFKMIFGEPSTPLFGDSFRIWLWVQPTDGSGVIEGVPPLVFGAGQFAKPERGFANTTAAQPDMLPPPTEAPPKVNAPPPGVVTAPCNTCGEPRPKGSTTCPHCGLP